MREVLHSTAGSWGTGRVEGRHDIYKQFKLNLQV
jgi:hypothetical protein